MIIIVQRVVGLLQKKILSVDNQATNIYIHTVYHEHGILKINF